MFESKIYLSKLEPIVHVLGSQGILRWAIQCLGQRWGYKTNQVSITIGYFGMHYGAFYFNFEYSNTFPKTFQNHSRKKRTLF